MQVKKRNGKIEAYNRNKIVSVLEKTFKATKQQAPVRTAKELAKLIESELSGEVVPIETIQNTIRDVLMKQGFCNAAEEFCMYRANREHVRFIAKQQQDFIKKYMTIQTNADATVDDNSNVMTRNISTMNAEMWKRSNIEVNREGVMNKLRELYPDFDAKEYVRMLQKHYIYKNDENSMGVNPPYCVSTSMYRFMLDGLEGIGGKSASPKNLDSYCGLYCNYIFAVSTMFAGAVATPEFLLNFDYFARKEWGDDYYKKYDSKISYFNDKTIQDQIHQHFQQVVYGINQPMGARGFQSAFTNFSYFDKTFFDGMFGEYYFPDGSRPIWESLDWLQKDFMMWFNEERLKTLLTFPVESVALVYKDGKWQDPEMFKFVCEEYARGHSFFTYISDTVDSLSSCCFKGDETIKLYDKNHNQFITTISDFVNHNDSNINSKGNNNMKDNYYIESYNLSGKQELTKVTGTLKKEYTGTMYTFSTDDNSSITVTAEHELMVRDKNKNIISMKAEDVAKNIEDYELVVE